MCVEDVSKVLICNSFLHFKVCILVYINLKTLFRVLLETTSFTCESEKGTPVFLPEKNILKKILTVHVRITRAGRVTLLSVHPQQRCAGTESFTSHPWKGKWQTGPLPWLMGVRALLALVFPAGMYTCWCPRGYSWGCWCLPFLTPAAPLLARNCAWRHSLAVVININL